MAALAQGRVGQPLQREQGALDPAECPQRARQRVARSAGLSAAGLPVRRWVGEAAGEPCPGIDVGQDLGDAYARQQAFQARCKPRRMAQP